MEVITKNSGILTNFEVFEHINESVAEKRQDKEKYGGKYGKIIESENEVAKYIKESTPRWFIAPQDVVSLTQELSVFGLTKAEVLQIINFLPAEAIHIHTIIEECHIRLSEEQIEQIIEAIMKHTHAKDGDEKKEEQFEEKN